jgi:hypothetical protein
MNLSHNTLHRYWVTGFIDAEGCFMIRIRGNKCKSGGFIELIFQIALHKKDRALLELIRASLGGVGNITNLGKDSILYRVSSVKD